MRQLSRHPVRTAALVVGLACNAVLVTVLVGLSASVTGSVRGLADLSGSADIQVSATKSDGFDSTLLDRILQTSGVQAAIPATLDHVVINDHDCLLLGLDARAAGLGGTIGQRVAREVAHSTRDPNDYLRGIFLGPAVAQANRVGTGGSVTVAAQQSLVLQVLDEIQTDSAVEPNRGEYAVVLLPVAQQLTGRTGRLNRIFVVAAPGADQDALRRSLAREVGDAAQVASISDAGSEASASIEPLQVLLGVVAGLVVALSAFLVFEMLVQAGTERRADLALIRLIGRRRSAVCCGFLGEVALVAVAAAAAGVGGGLLLVPHLVDAVPTYYNLALGAGIGYQFTPGAPVTGAVATVVAALIGAAVPAIAVTRTAPLESLVAADVDSARLSRWRLLAAFVAALSMAAALVLTYVVGADRAPAGTIATLLMGGVALVAAVMRRPLARGLARLCIPMKVAGQLAADSLNSSPRRTCSRLLISSTATATAIAVVGLTSATESAVSGLLAPQAAADLVVQTSPSAGIPSDVEMPGSWAAEIGAIPGVERVSRERVRWVQSPEGRLLVVGVDAANDEPLVHAASEAARRGVAASHGIILSRGLARALGVHSGDQLPPDNSFAPSQRKVLEVVDFPSAVGIGEAAVSLQDFDAVFGGSGVGRIDIAAAPGARDQVRAQVARLAHQAQLPATVYTGAEIAAGESAVLTQIAGLFAIFGWVVVGVATLSVVTSLLLEADRRRAEVGTLRIVGAARSDS